MLLFECYNVISGPIAQCVGMYTGEYIIKRYLKVVYNIIHTPLQLPELPQQLYLSCTVGERQIPLATI